MSGVIERVSPGVTRLLSRVIDPAVPADKAARDCANPIIRAVAIEMLRIGLIPRDFDELGEFLSQVTWDHPLHGAIVAAALPLVERRRAAAGGSR